MVLVFTLMMYGCKNDNDSDNGKEVQKENTENQSDETQKTNVEVRVGSFKGPTSIGLVSLMNEAKEGISSMADLKGKTIYLTGKGTTPDYVLQYLLEESGIADDEVTVEYKSEATEVAALLAENPDAIGLLPQPFVTSACVQNEKMMLIAIRQPRL